ncbi:hypothetical protein PT974_12113 [Cladobotryum mycophilum]|uniref:Mid2 domain-containing protein n=1 Tax=Cladobotryum mycophilum TaxID=491253 RepID=A0ABR0S818_9HYPO
MPNDFSRLPTTTALLVLSSLSQLVVGHSLPRETKTVAYHELNVVDYPLVAATPAPISPFELGRREFNTVCGYIGGDPAFPATCLAGSHCAVDLHHQAIGCCPDGGPCTKGIFTGCVDYNNHTQTVLDPYVYTCTGAEVCYKNKFDGGYYQYGCGTASQLATIVATSAFEHSSLEFSPDSSAATESGSATSTGTATGTSGAGAGGATSSSTSDPSAPDKGKNSKSSGPIVGGVVGGISALLVLGMFAFWFWRRRRQSMPKAYINPSAEKDNELRSHAYAQANLATNPPHENHERPLDNLTHDANTIGLAVPLDTVRSRPSDEIPLTHGGEKPQGGMSPTYEAEPYPGPRRAGGGSFWSQTRSSARSRDRSWV